MKKRPSAADFVTPGHTLILASTGTLASSARDAAPDAAGSTYVPGTWTNQAVTVAFACTDPGGSGVASFSAPVEVTTEGKDQTGTGSCTDAAGNVTTQSFGPIDIDLTPPEASLAFDPATGSMVVVGTDEGGSGIDSSPIQAQPAGPPKNRQSYTLTDGAGNTLVVLLDLTQHKSDAHASYVSLTYDRRSPIAAPPNDLHYDWTLKKNGSLKSLTQDLHLGSGKTEQHLVATYQANKDQTTIKLDGSPPVKQPGLVLVAVVTSNGTLSFVYPA